MFVTGLADDHSSRERDSYRIVFALGVGLLLACFVVGVAHELVRQRRLPSVSLDPLEDAQAFEQSGQLARAIREYRMAARIEQGNYETVRRIAELTRLLGDPSGLIDQFVRARSTWPRDPATHIALGWAYFNNRRFEEARACFQDGLRLDATRSAAHLGIGETFLEQDQFADAIAAFQQALRLEPHRAATHNSVGIAYALAGDRGKALSSFEAAVRLQPTPEYVQNLERARREGAAGATP